MFFFLITIHKKTWFEEHVQQQKITRLRFTQFTWFRKTKSTHVSTIQLEKATLCSWSIRIQSIGWPRLVRLPHPGKRTWWTHIWVRTFDENTFSVLLQCEFYHIIFAKISLCELWHRLLSGHCRVCWVRHIYFIAMAYEIPFTGMKWPSTLLNCKN